MTHATVAANFDQTLDVQRCISSQVTLNHEVLVDILSELGFVLESQVLDTGVGVDTSGGQNIVSCLTTDTEDIGETDLDSLFSRQINTGNTSQIIVAPPS